MLDSKANRINENDVWRYLDQGDAEFVLMSEPEYSIEAVDDFIDGLHGVTLPEETISLLRGMRHDGLQAYLGKNIPLMEAHLRALHMACRAAGIREALKDDAARGKKVKKSAAAGHVAVYGDAADKEARYLAMADECAIIHKNNPHWGKTAVRDQAAANCGVSAKTIQRRVDLDRILSDAK